MALLSAGFSPQRPWRRRCDALESDHGPDWPDEMVDVSARCRPSAVRGPMRRRSHRQTMTGAAGLGGIRIAVYDDLSAVERDSRPFEPHADGTVFQCFDWLSTWHRHIGARNGVSPAIVVAYDASAAILVLLPLAVCTCGFARELIWLGSELCDYNAPLLSQGSSSRSITPASRRCGPRSCSCCRPIHGCTSTRHPDQDAGDRRANQPHAAPAGTINPSGAYLTHLTGDWETFYTAKRSSATRRRDRTKRKKMSEIGEIRYVEPAAGAETLRALDILMTQKARLFAHMGVGNLFARPGYAEFYRALASGPRPARSSTSAGSMSGQPGRGQSRAHLSRLLLSPSGEL